MSARTELLEMLELGETVEAIVFGPWGWGEAPRNGDAWEPGYNEPDPPPVPFELRGRPMSLDEASRLMDGWSFYCGHGAPRCYAVYVWTTHRVLWVTQYDGATSLDSAPRHPVAVMPLMPGGG